MFGPTPKPPVRIPPHTEATVELKKEDGDDALLWQIATYVGHKALPTDLEVKTGHFRWNTLVLTVTGWEGFSEVLTSSWTPNPRLCAKDLVARFRDHCTYHSTLDRMVRERMKADAAQSP